MKAFSELRHIPRVMNSSQRFFNMARSSLSSIGVPGLRVAPHLFESVANTFRAMDETDSKKTKKQVRDFFKNLVTLHQATFAERQMLLEAREVKQKALNDFFSEFRQSHPNYKPEELQPALERALKKIGYIPERRLLQDTFRAKTIGLIPEILTPGPQAVVPADKANMVVNAVNGRWGSAYEAVKGANFLVGTERDYVHQQLDLVFDFFDTDHKKVLFSEILGFHTQGKILRAIATEGRIVTWMPKQGQKFIGYSLNARDKKEGILLENQGLKIEIKLSAEPVMLNAYAIDDIVLEASLTVIIDKEDSSVSATAIKSRAEENIAKLRHGSLTAELSGGRGVRSLNRDTFYEDANTGYTRTLKRTAEWLVRGVSDHLMLSVDEININGEPVSEKTWDLLLSAMSGVQYHVLPKMHHEKEVALVMRELALIEDMLFLPRYFFKVGIMNEEFEMNLRLREALSECRDRVFFVNSGFLDKFGSDIEATMHAGPVTSYRALNRTAIKLQYERNNVSISHQAGIAQIGAGMWPKINDQAGHRQSKILQIREGNDVSWNPNPRFSVLHALCYHTNPPVDALRQALQPSHVINEADLYMPPLGNFTDSSRDDYVSAEEIQDSLREATFGLIGYATPWITKGVGCSAIDDLNGEPLMEDRATARIKAAFLRNWLHHGIITKAQFMAMVEDVSKAIPGVTPEVKNAIVTLVLNPSNRLNALVEEAFMTGYQAAHASKQAVHVTTPVCRL